MRLIKFSVLCAVLWLVACAGSPTGESAGFDELLTKARAGDPVAQYNVALHYLDTFNRGDTNVSAQDNEKLYEEVQGNSIKLPELVMEILRQFLGADRGFVAFKKENAENSTPQKLPA